MATHRVGESGGVLVFSENPETVGELLTLGANSHRACIAADRRGRWAQRSGLA